MVRIVYIIAAQYSKKNVQTLQCLIDNYNGNIKEIINQKLLLCTLLIKESK